MSLCTISAYPLVQPLSLKALESRSWPLVNATSSSLARWSSSKVAPIQPLIPLPSYCIINLQWSYQLVYLRLLVTAMESESGTPSQASLANWLGKYGHGVSFGPSDEWITGNLHYQAYSWSWSSFVGESGMTARDVPPSRRLHGPQASVSESSRLFMLTRTDNAKSDVWL